MKVAKTVLHPTEANALAAIARSRVPEMLVLYDAKTGEPMTYINLN